MRKIVRGFFASWMMGFDAIGKQWPIWYRMKETEQTIVLKRAISNVIYHALFKILIVILASILLFFSFISPRSVEFGLSL